MGSQRWKVLFLKLAMLSLAMAVPLSALGTTLEWRKEAPMEHEPEQPTGDSHEPGDEPPPFQPDPDLIAYLEHGGKPSEAEVREMAARIRTDSDARDDRTT